MKLSLVGDAHSDTAWMLNVIEVASAASCDAIMQLGDFGVWPGVTGVKFLRKVNSALVKHGLDLFFLDGNHDDFPQIYKHKLYTSAGFRPMRSNILHVPRGLVWQWDNTKYMGLGGAVSIDRQWRTPGQTWWPEEQISPAEEAYATEQAQQPIDVLFTHDSPVNVPMAGLKTDIESYMHRLRVTDIAKLVDPQWWFHGHMHSYMKYYYANANVMGLACNTMPNSSVVIDANNGKIILVGELNNGMDSRRS